MGKILVGVAVGVFAGALVLEIVRRTSPQCWQKVRAGIRESARAAKQAFREGYRAGAETT